ncbi:MAG: site-specific integrase [Methylomicrobium sp.]|nr:site-specific integrase [Methylomicrobium sp.]
MAKRTPGLRKKGEIWHIEKVIAGQLIRVSTGEKELEAAERYLAKLIDERRKIVIYGERIERTFDEAAARYIEENDHKRSLDRDIVSLKAVMPFIGEMELSKIHAGSLDGYIKSRKLHGITAGTLNRDMAIIKRVLSLAARYWRDENGKPWLDTVPMLPTVKGETRKPRPISWPEQERLLKNLPGYLADMVLFMLNTGLRDQELCGLKWAEECRVNGLDAAVFVITDERTKNAREKIVPLNAVARSIIDSKRGNGSDYVFAFEGRKLDRMNNKAWRKAREAANLKEVRVHDLRHTFGMRLRSVGVGFEDRQDLLGHHAGRITTHYSKVEIARLIECVELLCETRKPELTLIRRTA